MITPTLFIILIYLQVYTFREHWLRRPSLSRGLPIYICILVTWLSHNLIGCSLVGTCIMYVNFIGMHIATYITLLWLYMNIKHYIWIYEYIIIKNLMRKITNIWFVYIYMVWHKFIISIAIVCIVCDGKWDCSMFCDGKLDCPANCRPGCKSCTKKCFFCKKKQVGHTTFLVWPTGQLYATCVHILH